LIITVLHQFIATGQYSYPEYNVAVGQVADFEVIAPFDFPVLKSEKDMQVERSRVLEKPIHSITAFPIRWCSMHTP
jgi:hypothetical protein